MTSAEACGLRVDLSRVQVSTIHCLCHRLLASHAGEVGLWPGYRVLDDGEQNLLLHQEFEAIFGPDREMLSGRWWGYGVHTVEEANQYFDRICYELIDIEGLTGSEKYLIAALCRCLLRYRQLLLAKNTPDFAYLQVWAEHVTRGGNIAAIAAINTRYLMVDEFQDTSLSPNPPNGVGRALEQDITGMERRPSRRI